MQQAKRVALDGPPGDPPPSGFSYLILGKDWFSLPWLGSECAE